MRLGSLIRSEPFKATLRVLTVFLILFAVASWALVKSVEVTLRDDLQARIQVETDLLTQIYRKGGKPGLLSALDMMGYQGRASDRVYGLFDQQNFNLTGPISNVPSAVGFATHKLSVLNGDQINGDYFLWVDKIDRFTVVVGRDGAQIENAKQRLLQGLVVFGALLASATLLLGLSAARRSQLRLDEMEAALRKISAGQLDARLPFGTRNDQFDRVAKRMNANLDQLERLVSSLKTTASAIAHDLKTPLSHAQIALHHAADAVANNELASAKIGDALAETDKLNSLFETILRLSRIQTSKGRSMFELTNLKEIADKALAFFEPLAEEKGQSLEFSGTDAQINADPDMIQQAVINLVQNACVHAGQGARIAVIVTSDPKTVTLTVRDSGPGIPVEDIDTVLDPFVRGALDRSTSGHGLGLAIVGAIAELHEAELTLNNTSTGFEVSLKFPILNNL